MKLNHQSSCESHLRLEQRGNASTKSLLQLSVVTQFFPPDFAATGQLIDELIRQLRQQDVDVGKLEKPIDHGDHQGVAGKQEIGERT